MALLFPVYGSPLHNSKHIHAGLSQECFCQSGRYGWDCLIRFLFCVEGTGYNADGMG